MTEAAVPLGARLARVVEVRAGGRRVGSGYLLTDRLVLTAHHVVEVGGPIGVRLLHAPGPPLSPASRCWPQEPVDATAEPERDVALLEIAPSPGTADPGTCSPPGYAVRFGAVTGERRVPCHALGFPDAERLPDGRRDTIRVSGEVEPLQGYRYGLLTFSCDLLLRRGDSASLWQGMSGGPLFTDDGLLVGVLVRDRDVARNRTMLRAVSVRTMLGLPGFRDTVRAYGFTPRLAREPLDTYLRTVRPKLVDQPYAGVLGCAPPLSEVYLRQQVRCVDGTRGGERNGSPTVSSGIPLPAADLLDQARTCVVLAGPGGGKTSLLRTWLDEGIARSLSDDVLSAPVPVLVPARALIDGERRLMGGSWANALAGAVSREYWLECPGLFSAPPVEGVPWLVLVDGLDEILDNDTRRRLVQHLAGIAQGPDADLYRFVVATRPLPQGELDRLGAQVPRYDLLPFRREELAEVAESWFTALGVADPAGTAVRFVAEALPEKSLVEQARIPLMMALLCQLHAHRPDRPLPSSRGRIYDDFVKLLHEYQEQRAADPDAARSLAKCAFDLAGHVAKEHLGMPGAPLTDLLRGWRGEPPPGMTARETVLRSGLLVERAGGIEFLQRTFLEHCAAHHATRTPEERAGVAAGLFSGGRARHWPWRPVKGVRWSGWGQSFWTPPDEPTSYIGFVLDRLLDEARDPGGAAEVTRNLMELTAKSNLRGCRFIAQQKRLGTGLPDPVTRAAARSLVFLARITDDDRGRADLRAHPERINPEVDPAIAAAYFAKAQRNHRVAAAEALAWLGDEEAADILAELAETRYLVDGDWRVEAADRLVRLNDKRGLPVLHRLASDTWLRDETRVQAAGYLVEHGDARGVSVLHGLARDKKVLLNHRVLAVHVLASIGHAESADTLAALAHDADTQPWVRWWAVERLTSIGDGRGPELLAGLAQDAGQHRGIRLNSALALIDADRTRGAEALAALAGDIGLRGRWRLLAASALAEHDARRAATVVDALADDPTLAPRHRRKARRLL